VKAGSSYGARARPAPTAAPCEKLITLTRRARTSRLACRLGGGVSLLPLHRREAAVELGASLTHSSTSTAPFTESRAAINVVAACTHAAFSEVFSSLVTRRDLLVVAPDPKRGLILHRLVMQDEDCSTIYHWEELIRTDAEARD
jgi:hypothetical protein